MYAKLLHRHRIHWSNAQARTASILSVFAFAASLVVQYYSIVFATARVSNPVTDLILSNIPVVDVDGIYVYGLFFLVAFISLLCLSHPKRMPFILYSLALFIVIRSVFVVLTHLAPYPIPPQTDFGTTMSKIFFGGDLFFSGHTGVPFLIALIYWKEKGLRNIFLMLSVFFGGVVLLGHLHYSIDVLAAFFITYTIFHIAEWLFPSERALFLSDPIAPAH
jgi:hypothetical protein